MFTDIFYYDETSPTCLRWKVDVHSGKNGNQTNVKAGDVAGSAAKSRKFHFVVTVGSKQYLVHRVIYEMFYGLADTDEVDHFNGDDKDNRIGNLRSLTHAVNMRNCKKRVDNKTGVTGVTMRVNHRGKIQYTAQWRTLDGKQKSKTFSVAVHGDQAFHLACECRQDMIDKLNQQNAGYTDEHGKRG